MAAIIVFRGSTMDGVDVDLVSWCDLDELTDEQYDKLWGEINETDLLELCASAEILFDGEIDETPGYSDSYYRVETDNQDKLKAELKALILEYSGQF